METLMETELIQNNRAGNAKASKKDISPSFITANSEEVSIDHLKQDCIIPSFSKDNETTTSHQEFIESAYEAAIQVFPHENVSEVPQIRVSHVIKGRIPEAVGKPAKELQEWEKTIFYERMAFLFDVKSVTTSIDGNELALSIGGVRSYNLENLYSKKSAERFKVFIGFKNSVCCNLCVHSDGFVGDLRASSTIELMSKMMELFQGYEINRHLALLDHLNEYKLTEKQFSMFLGRARLYNYLPKNRRVDIPLLNMNDAQVNAVAKGYYDDPNFRSNEASEISLWHFYNLLTGSVKSSYIDNFLERTVNAYQLTEGLSHALRGGSKYKWFIQ